MSIHMPKLDTTRLRTEHALREAESLNRRSFWVVVGVSWSPEARVALTMIVGIVCSNIDR